MRRGAAVICGYLRFVILSTLGTRTLKETNEPNVCTGSRGTQPRVSAKNTVLFPARPIYQNTTNFFSLENERRKPAWKLNSFLDDASRKKAFRKTRVRNITAHFYPISPRRVVKRGKLRCRYVPTLSLLRSNWKKNCIYTR